MEEACPDLQQKGRKVPLFTTFPLIPSVIGHLAASITHSPTIWILENLCSLSLISTTQRERSQTLHFQCDSNFVGRPASMP
ncbi:hypothetical protein V6N12_071310 [Hibiscus sabdariffa]|uniref:Uncharacterized protein n=1 Tax=Hibiscus sabdariffa TaxID=183260 RepID=A0ABR2FJG5_9ROSI